MIRRGKRPATSTYALGVGHRIWRRLRRWVQVLLVVVSIAGLSPLAAATEILLADAHPAEAVASWCIDDCEEGCTKSGCHGAVHHCRCCAPAPYVPPSDGLDSLNDGGDAGRLQPLALRRPPERAQPPPRQPPRG
jgi:hypothetical protein